MGDSVNRLPYGTPLTNEIRAKDGRFKETQHYHYEDDGAVLPVCCRFAL